METSGAFCIWNLGVGMGCVAFLKVSESDSGLVAGVVERGTDSVQKRRVEQEVAESELPDLVESDAGNKLVPEVSAKEDDQGIDTPQVQVAPDKKNKAPDTGDTPTEKLEDFGEVLQGAQKHLYTLNESLSEDVDVQALPLSQSFPKPDYAKLVEGGLSKPDAAFIAQLRGEIPVKPRKGWKLSEWVKKVEAARAQAAQIMSGDLSLTDAGMVDKFRGEPGYLRFLPDVMLLAKGLPVDRVERLGDFKISANHYSMIMDRVNGEDVPQKNVTKYDVVDITGKGYGRMNSGKPVHFDTPDDAVAYIKAQVESPNQSANRTTKIDMWSERGKEGVFVGKKVGSHKYIELGKGFKNATAAARFIDENYDSLVEQLKAKRKKPQFRREANLPRIGPDRRQGKDVTPEQFTEAFGFRGVQFGNWVEGSKRRDDLNQAYDGLMDLAELLGVPTQALSLNGELGLAFGARGKGGSGASAHYEPGTVVINLTKKAGAGSLAHEWWHALDNYFGRMEKSGDGFATNFKRDRKLYAVEDGRTVRRETTPDDFAMRTEVYEAFRGVTDAIQKETALAERSAKLDTTRGKDYWSTVIEMTARSFERYVIDKLGDQGYSSDFLANIMSEPQFDAVNSLIVVPDSSYPYPLKSEMDVVNGAYDRLFDTLETRETEQGVALFSEDSKPASGSTVEAVRNDLSGKVRDLTFLEQSGQLQIVPLASDLPVDAASNAVGLYQDGKVYLVADNISAGDAYGVFLHEAGEHAGLSAMLGDKKYQQVVDQFDRLLRSKNADAVRAAERVPGNTPDEHVASERLAYLIEDFTNTQLRSGGAKLLAQRVLSAVKAWAMDKLPDWVTRKIKLSPADIQALAVRGARSWAAGKGSGPDGGGQFSQRADEAGQDSDVWSDVDKLAPKEGVELRKEQFKKAGEWVKNNAVEFSKNGLNKLLTLRQLVENAGQYLPSATRYMTRVDKMLAERNKMQSEGSELAGRWLGLDKLVKNRLAHVMHEATRAGVDPSQTEFEPQTVEVRGGMAYVKALLADEAYKVGPNVRENVVQEPATDENLELLNKLRAKRNAEVSKSAKNGRHGKESWELLKDGQRRANEQWKRMKNANLADRNRRAEFDGLQRKYNALSPEARAIFNEARDMYEARFDRTLEALLKDIENSELDSNRKKALATKIRHDFEQAKVHGVYFPLHRKGDYYVFAEREKTGEINTYTKKPGRVLETVNTETGEVQYLTESNGAKFDTEREAIEASMRWSTAEGAMASANTRQDLIGKDLVAVEQGNGYVLEDSAVEKVFSMVGTAREAELLAAEFEKEGLLNARYGKQDVQKTQDDLAAMSGFMQLIAVMDDAGQPINDGAYQAYLQVLPDLSMRKNHIHRKSTAGFSEDALGAFSSAMMHQAHQISKLEARDDFGRILKDIAKESKSVPQAEAVAVQNIRDEIKLRHDWIMNPSNASWTNWTSGFGFFMYLGFSPAAALVNLSQTAVVAYPSLAAEFGWNKAGKALMAAAKQLNMRETVMGDDAIDRKYLSDDEADAMDQWQDLGAIDKSQAQMLAGIGDTDSLQNSPTYQKWMGRTAHLFHKAEVVNREVTLLAGYRLAREAGQSHDQAIKLAAGITWDSQFDYSNANRARIMQSDAAKVFLMFKSYSQHVIYYLLKNASVWGKGGPEGKKAQARLLGVLGVTMAMGGVSALPLGVVGLATAAMYSKSKYGTKRTLQGAAGITGLLLMASLLWDDDEPFEWDVEVRAALREMGGEHLEALVMRGAFNAATGVNMSGRVSLDSLLWREPDRELEGRDLATHYLKEAAGPVVGYALNAPVAWDLLTGGNEARGAEKLAPKFMRDLIRVGRYGGEGALNLRGDELVGMDWLGMPYSDELNAWNLLWQASGFTPEKLGRRYQQNSDYKKYEQHVIDGRSRLLSQYYLHWIERDGEGMRDTMARMDRWNKANPKAAKLDSKAISRSMKARMRASKASMSGVHTNLNYRYLAKELGL